MRGLSGPHTTMQGRFLYTQHARVPRSFLISRCTAGAVPATQVQVHPTLLFFSGYSSYSWDLRVFSLSAGSRELRSGDPLDGVLHSGMPLTLGTARGQHAPMELAFCLQRSPV